jgi:demethylmenaquinone methyltransferase/2-methoxy-6-polyprenyl-1,4-benzoquinol methylase
VRTLGFSGTQTAIDLCTGTADLVLALAKPGRARRVIGIDFSGEMLRLGLRKVRRSVRGVPALLARGDAMRLPAAEACADGLTIAFGIRNVERPDVAAGECLRVLRPGGRLAILEFGAPQMPGFRQFYQWYFRHVLPGIGRLVSRHDDAYTYLPASVGAWATPDQFCKTLSAAGFADVRAVPLTFGVVYLYTARRP